jgi:hypothetical protein
MILQDNKIYFKNMQVDTIPCVPNGNWLVRFDERDLFFFLERMHDFTIPEKIYGDCDYLTDRYLKTFKKYDKNLGISLSGVKGTGKSLTAKMLAMKSDLPVIIINEPFTGSMFNSFIESINQECIVFIDEFEKVYSKSDDQSAMLTLLDGAFMSKKLFLFTSNETSRFSNYLMNRPGRIHYFKEYKRIDDKTLTQIIDDTLVDKTKEEELRTIINFIDDANIDMVFSLIREMNDFNEGAKEAVEHLNISISSDSEHKILIQTKNNIIYETTMNRNPFFYGEFQEWFCLDEGLSKAAGLTDEEKKKLSDRGDDEKRFACKIQDCKVLKTTSEYSQLVDEHGNIITIKKLSPYRFVF